MTIYRTSGKNIEIYEEYELYTKEYVENVGGKSSFTADGGTEIDINPLRAKPLGISNLYVKVRLKEGYNGEFGFDWVDVNPDTKDIEKIQGVPFSEVEYFFKEGNTPDELGNIIEKNTDIAGARKAIEKQYNFNNWCKYVDIPYVLIKPNQEIELSAEIVLCEGELKEDFISITGDDFYEFEITGGEKEGKIAKKKITAGEKLNLKIKCLKESSDMTFNFKHYNSTKGETLVGGIFMMGNKVLKLKFRVIALVSSDGVPNDKAKALFKKFKEAGVKDYLNKNSLNQAGYEVEIENFAEMDNADVDDYFYAFNKADWASEDKKYFSRDPERKRYYTAKNDKGELDTFNEIQEGQLGNYYWESTDVNGKKVKNVKQNDIDYITTKEYKSKLKAKSKSYDSGGLIILSDLEDTNPAIAAYSRIYPIEHYILFVTSTATASKSTCAHEIGHMLGLEHSFCDSDILERRKKIEKFIEDNIQPCKLKIEEESKSNQISPTNKTPKPLKNQNKSPKPFKSYNVLKSTLIKGIDNSNLYYSARINLYNGYITDKTNYSSYGWGDKKVTKEEFKKNCTVEINKYEKFKNENILAKKELEKYTESNLIDFNNSFYLISEEELKIYQDYLKYKLLKEWEDTTKQYLYFRQKSTENIMDYGQVISDGKDINKKNRLLHHQILIMRGDYENYN